MKEGDVPQDVEFRSGGEVIRGHLYRPDNATGPVPIIVMAGGWCYVKELVQPHYADAFVRAGCAALVFDYRRLGASDGTPRQHLDPWDQIEDYRNAISYAETLEGIDPERIGIWGISYSGGHSLVVGALDPRIKCIVSTIPVVDGLINMERVHGALGFRRLRDTVLANRRTLFSSGEHGYMPMSSTNPSTELVTWPFPEVTPVFLELQRCVVKHSGCRWRRRSDPAPRACCPAASTRAACAHRDTRARGKPAGPRR